MPLPAAPNAISLNQIQTEFGGSNPISLSEYYKGGAYVSTSDTAPNVPTSGAISLGNFHSAAKYSRPPSVEYLVVAGGGSSGGGFSGYDGYGWIGGGGGAGGYLTGTLSTPAGTYTVTVGAGGAAPWEVSGAQGSASVFGSITATGGGSGGGGYSSTAGGSGGSGGGGSGDFDSIPNADWSPYNNSPGGSGTSGQGYAGGASAVGELIGPGPDRYIEGAQRGGGGGGAGEAGNTDAVGDGGDGLESSISGTATFYAGGGAGGGGAGGTGGGGNSYVAGTVNTGGGGGGAPAGLSSGRAGGSGIVIIRYSDTYSNAASTTGSPTLTVSGGYRIYKFTGSGSIQF